MPKWEKEVIRLIISTMGYLGIDSEVGKWWGMIHIVGKLYTKG